MNTNAVLPKHHVELTQCSFKSPVCKVFVCKVCVNSAWGMSIEIQLNKTHIVTGVNSVFRILQNNFTYTEKKYIKQVHKYFRCMLSFFFFLHLFMGTKCTDRNM